MTAASVKGISIEYDAHGEDDGEPLLLVTGLGGQLFDNPDIGPATKMATPPPPACSTRSASNGRTSSAPRWDDIIDEIVENARRAGADGTSGVRAMVR